MTYPNPNGDPTPMPVPIPNPKHADALPGRREQAYTNAFELLVLSELARADDDVTSAAELHARACWELESIGMHGPVILALTTEMLGEAEEEAVRRRETTPPWVGRMLRDLDRLNTAPEPSAT